MSNSFRVKLTPIRLDLSATVDRLSADEFVAWQQCVQELHDQWQTRLASADAGTRLIDQPERMLADHRSRRSGSELGQIFGAAKRIREHLDRIVLLADDGAYRAARMLFAASCHPFHNELSRGERGSKPRLYFDGYEADNDRTQGLLDLLVQRTPPGIDGAWGVIAVGASDRPAWSAALEIYLAALRERHPHHPRLGQWMLPVAVEGDPLTQIAATLGCTHHFSLPPDLHGQQLLFTAAALLPASVVGLDVVKLLEGAALTNQQLRAVAAVQSDVLRLAALVRWLRKSDRCEGLQLQATTQAGAAVAAWHASFCRDSVEGSGKLLRPPAQLQLCVDEVRRDRLRPLAGPETHVDCLADTHRAHLEEEQQSQLRAGQPCGKVHLARLDEGSLGQLCQLLLLLVAASQ